jgi:hypothetical protein
MRCRRPLALGAAVPVALLSLLAAGCGGGGSPGVAKVATSSTTATTPGTPAGAGMQGTGLVAYAACMRSHGVPGFPDPVGEGGIPKQAVISAFQAVSSARAAAAQSSCKHLLPAGGSLGGRAAAPVTIQDRQIYLRAAACMRSHGVPDFPDPTFPNGSVHTDIPPSINQDSAGFRSAAAICTRSIPAGLPYSSAGGS